MALRPKHKYLQRFRTFLTQLIHLVLNPNTADVPSSDLFFAQTNDKFPSVHPVQLIFTVCQQNFWLIISVDFEHT